MDAPRRPSRFPAALTFTLIELVFVITILVILGIVGFLSV
jgi:type II secretory pathway pseudopilin PulG